MPTSRPRGSENSRENQAALRPGLGEQMLGRSLSFHKGVWFKSEDGRRKPCAHNTSWSLGLRVEAERVWVAGPGRVTVSTPLTVQAPVSQSGGGGGKRAADRGGEA